MYYQLLTDDEILDGFRSGNARIIREYFYGYCQTGYYIFDKRYDLSSKQNLDFMSLAHQYALYLMEHDWKPLEDHSPAVSLRTWIINGFRYVVLDALKWYKREYGSIKYEDYLMSFDLTSDLRLQFHRMVEDLCDNASLDRKERLIVNMLLIQGFKAKDIAAQLEMTPSALSQRYKKLKEQVIVPYFRKNFDMNLDMPVVMNDEAQMSGSTMLRRTVMPQSEAAPIENMIDLSRLKHMDERKEYKMNRKRTTPDFITELQPNEIFVFGSNLKGLHGGGAAYIAHRRFGAIMGQGVGLQGQSYAIPTMQGGVETIRPYVDEFIKFAQEHPELTFLVTRIGCGIAGFTDDEIAPLFRQAYDKENIVLPEGW